MRLLVKRPPYMLFENSSFCVIGVPDQITCLSLLGLLQNPKTQTCFSLNTREVGLFNREDPVRIAVSLLNRRMYRHRKNVEPGHITYTRLYVLARMVAFYGGVVRSSIQCMHDSCKTPFFERNGQKGARCFTRNIKEEALLMWN